MCKSRIELLVNVDLALKYIDRIREYANRYNNEYEAFVEDTMFMDACITNINNITQCVIRIKDHCPDEFEKYFDRRIQHGLTGMRRIVIHDYEFIQTEIIWDFITEDMPKLESIFRQIQCDYRLSGNQGERFSEKKP